MYTLTSGTKKIELAGRTLIMGILNVTPDSFSDGGLYFESGESAEKKMSAALGRVEVMVAEGADIVDIGGESTRPGSDPVTAAEEIARVVPVIRAIREKLGSEIWISIDTDKAEVAGAALAAGADMLNSLGGLSLDPNILEVLQQYDCPFCLYHTRGLPKEMQVGEIVYTDVVAEIKEFFVKEIQECERAGIERSRIILDPGIGFGKTVEHTIEIIQRLGEFKDLGCPILVGISRKSHLGAILKTELDLLEAPAPLERIEAGLAETAIAVQNGAAIVRTHDVLATKKFLATFDRVRRELK